MDRVKDAGQSFLYSDSRSNTWGTGATMIGWPLKAIRFSIFQWELLLHIVENVFILVSRGIAINHRLYLCGFSAKLVETTTSVRISLHFIPI